MINQELRDVTPSARTESLRRRAQELIPAGAHTYSKADDQFPLNAPAFIERGEGAYVWDTDDRRFVDWGMGIRSVVLGHAYPRVLEAVRQHLERGSNFSRPTIVEGELAEQILGLLPSSDMIKFAKNGSDATSAAVRLARAATGRKFVAMCRDNPFYSVDDWFIGTTVMNAGVPEEFSALTLPFGFGDVRSLEALFAEHPGEIACVVIEPAGAVDTPCDAICARCAARREGESSAECRNAAFLAEVTAITRRNGAVLVFDEMLTGFRWHLPGAQTLYGIEPDLSCFGKALGNGFAVSTVAGRRELMELGGLRQTEQPKVFLLSTTHGGETHSLAAALAVVAEMHEHPVIEHLWRIGKLLQDGVNDAARDLGIRESVGLEGYPCSPNLVCRDGAGNPSPEFRTLFLQELVRRGVLMINVSPSFSHGEHEVDLTVHAAAAALEVYREALERGGVAGLLEGRAVRPAIRKFN